MHLAHNSAQHGQQAEAVTNTASWQKQSWLAARTTCTRSKQADRGPWHATKGRPKHGNKSQSYQWTVDSSTKECHGSNGPCAAQNCHCATNTDCVPAYNHLKGIYTQRE